MAETAGVFGTHATVGADMSQLMATFFTGLFVIGWIQARRRRADAHHWMMLADDRHVGVHKLLFISSIGGVGF
jgi:hypothetical protein